uniref:G protein-coupled receptor n=1 Tax=Panagrellus redivivus TaxID=6233 RepID=A0A7E4W6M0_PANRE
MDPNQLPKALKESGHNFVVWYSIEAVFNVVTIINGTVMIMTFLRLHALHMYFRTVCINVFVLAPGIDGIDLLASALHNPMTMATRRHAIASAQANRKHFEATFIRPFKREGYLVLERSFDTIHKRLHQIRQQDFEDPCFEHWRRVRNRLSQVQVRQMGLDWAWKLLSGCQLGSQQKVDRQIVTSDKECCDKLNETKTVDFHDVYSTPKVTNDPTAVMMVVFCDSLITVLSRRHQKWPRSE